MSVLEQILHDKTDEVAEHRRRRPLAELRRLVQDLPPVRDFLAVLRADGAQGKTSPRVIAEVKKASPSKGLIRPDFDPVAIAQTYAANGAAALSVLTDAKYFQGHLGFLEAISTAVTLPLLRKDFTVDAYQVYESRAAHADVLVVSESGINTAADITRLREKGVHAFLIGEALMRAPDPGVKLRELLYGPGEDLRH